MAVADTATGGLRVRAAACITQGERILLVEHVKAGRHRWLLPGGGVEEGETLAEAVARETAEETGLTVEVGRLVLVCEVIEPGGRHLINMVYAATTRGGRLRAGTDGVLASVAWHDRTALAGVALHPPIATTLLDIWDEGFAGPVAVLGNVWAPDAGEPGTGPRR